MRIRIQELSSNVDPLSKKFFFFYCLLFLFVFLLSSKLPSIRKTAVYFELKVIFKVGKFRKHLTNGLNRGIKIQIFNHSKELEFRCKNNKNIHEGSTSF